MNRVMEKSVTSLWWRVCAKEKGFYLSSHNNVIGNGNLGDYVYNSFYIKDDKRIEQLKAFLEQLDLDHEDLRFYDLLKTKEGENWTDFHQKLDFFASMLNAVGILEYIEEPVYKIGEAINPKIKIIK